MGKSINKIYLFFFLLVVQSNYSLPLFSQILDFEVVSDVELDSSLSETSGVVFAKGKLWTHTDSDGRPEIYAIDPENGDILQTITLEGLINHDWEDIASDEFYLYIADTGNNNGGNRTDLAVYKISLDDIPMEGDAVIPRDKIEVISFFYPEQGEYPDSTGSNNTPFDCEAIVVMNDTIHLFTKDWTSIQEGYSSAEYILPNEAHPEGMKYPAQLLKHHHQVGFLVTGADNLNLEHVVLVGYQIEGIGAICVRLYSDFQNNDISTGESQAKVIGTVLTAGQVEAVCFGDMSEEIYITNEYFKHNDFIYPAKIKSLKCVYE